MGEHDISVDSGCAPTDAVGNSVDVAREPRIGYGYFYDDELFDLSPGSALEGIAFLNDMTYWESNDEELTRSFLHELGHRWGARVQS